MRPGGTSQTAWVLWIGNMFLFTLPPGTGSTFYNYKHFLSNVLTALVNSCYRFLYVDVSWGVWWMLTVDKAGRHDQNLYHNMLFLSLNRVITVCTYKHVWKTNAPSQMYFAWMHCADSVPFIDSLTNNTVNNLFFSYSYIVLLIIFIRCLPLFLCRMPWREEPATSLLLHHVLPLTSLLHTAFWLMRHPYWRSTSWSHIQTASSLYSNTSSTTGCCKLGGW